jgi:hypothetical protein
MLQSYHTMPAFSSLVRTSVFANRCAHPIYRGVSRRWLSERTNPLVDWKHPLRAMMLSALYGLFYHLEETMHIDGSYSAAWSHERRYEYRQYRTGTSTNYKMPLPKDMMIFGLDTCPKRDKSICFSDGN